MPSTIDGSIGTDLPDNFENLRFGLALLSRRLHKVAESKCSSTIERGC